MADVNMPKLSDTMEEGTVVEWKKNSGEDVKPGDVLAEVESDKATFDLEAEAEGKLEILVEQGVPAKIGAPIARIGAGGAQAPEKAKPKEPPTTPQIAEERAPTQKSAPAQKAPPKQEAEPGAPPPAEQRPADRSDGEVKASPLAKRLAAEMG